MEILMVSAELAPYVRGSLAADAVASLAKALRQLGHNVTVAVPRQPGFEAAGLLLARRLTPLPLPDGGEVPVLDGQLPSGVQLTLFDAPVLFDRPGVFGEGGKPYPDNARRYALLSMAAAALVRQREQQGNAFDIVHLHDAPAALVPLALRRLPGPSVPTVLTVHDATLQGEFSSAEAASLGVPREVASDESLRDDGRIHFLRSGILNADAVTTVSPTYAREMLTEERLGSLGPAIVAAGKSVIGIVNGVDYALYNPATDTALVSRYDAEDASNKGLSKTAALRALELELEPSRPLVLTLADPSPGAGFDLVAGALPALFKQDATLVIAGALPAGLAKKVAAVKTRHRERLAVVEDADSSALRRLYAAADIVLIPSRHEPCGVSQLIAQRYGAAPVARATGGLCDTIVDADAGLSTGTGFLFDQDDSDALLGAFARAVAGHASPRWATLRRRIMRLDLGWDRPARRYLQTYRQTLAAGR